MKQAEHLSYPTGCQFVRSSSALIPAEKFALLCHHTLRQHIPFHIQSTMRRCLCTARTARAALKPGSTSALPIRLLHAPATSHVATTSYSPSQFSIPQLLPFPNPTSPYEGQGKGKGKGKDPEPPNSNEEEVDDAEWQMRVGTSILRPKASKTDGQAAQ